jgi:hypothetical protein
MGLSLNPGDFYASYSRFANFRNTLAAAAGLPPNLWKREPDPSLIYLMRLHNPGLSYFLMRKEHDEMPLEFCRMLLKEVIVLTPLILLQPVGDQISDADTWEGVLNDFLDSVRQAVETEVALTW